MEEFLQGLPEKALNLGIRILLSAVVFFIGIQVIKLFRRFLKSRCSVQKRMWV